MGHSHVCALPPSSFHSFIDFRTSMKLFSIIDVVLEIEYRYCSLLKIGTMVDILVYKVVTMPLNLQGKILVVKSQV